MMDMDVSGIDATFGMTPDTDAVVEPLFEDYHEDHWLAGTAQEDFFNPCVGGDVIGRPDVQATAWEYQKLDDNCAPTAEGSIIKQFGYDLTQEDFAYISKANGWYQPGEGTSIEDIGKMMDAFGIGNHTVENAGIADLMGEVMQGHGIIVPIRSGQLWEEGPMNDLLNFVAKKLGFDNAELMPADHALCVTGFDFNDPANPKVILNDSGVSDGNSIDYPLAKFHDAWGNGNYIQWRDL